MATEIELKCLMSLDNLDRAEAWILARGNVVSERVTLVNRYYDTADFQLNRHKIALRIREKNGGYIQTLKTKGASVGGLHQRNEWEWPLASDALDLSLLKGTAWPADLQDAQLAPLFETNFTRHQLTLNHGDSRIEVAVDRGQVLAGGRSLPIQELELELLSGRPGDVLSLAEALAEQVGFQVSDLSKGERGYFLAGVLSLMTPEALMASEAGNVTELAKRWIKGLDLCALTGDVDYLRASMAAVQSLMAQPGVRRAQASWEAWLHSEVERISAIMASVGQENCRDSVVAGSQSGAKALLALLGEGMR